MQILTGPATETVWIIGNVDKSSSPLDSYDGIRLSLSWRASDNSIWLGYHNQGFGEEFLSNADCWSKGTWTLFKLKTKLVISCERVKVYEILYKDLFDSQLSPLLQRSVKALSKTVTNIWFEFTQNAEFKTAGNILLDFQPSLHYAKYLAIAVFNEDPKLIIQFLQISKLIQRL